MDRILIAELPLDCHIGVSDEERAEEQRVLADVELRLDLAPAGRWDDLGKSLDYELIANAVIEVAQEKPRKLLEALAEDVAGMVLERFGVGSVVVRLKKASALAALGAPYASVEIERGA